MPLCRNPRRRSLHTLHARVRVPLCRNGASRRVTVAGDLSELIDDARARGDGLVKDVKGKVKEVKEDNPLVRVAQA